jgi:hypothetical protein
MNELLQQKFFTEATNAGCSSQQAERLSELHALISTEAAPIRYIDLVKAALKNPRIFFGMKPETSNANVEGSAALLGLTRAQFTAAALKQTPLFGRKPETINANVEGSAALLGLTKAQFTVAALEHLPLLYRKPETVNAHVEGSAALLGLTKAQFTAAALKCPSLFGRKPESLKAKKPYILKIAKELSEAKDFAALVQYTPTALTRAKTSLHARYIIAKLGLKRGDFTSLLWLSSAKATALIVGYYTAKIEKTGNGRRALQVMHAHGVIDRLPLDIPPVPRPPRRAGAEAVQPSRAGVALSVRKTQFSEGARAQVGRTAPKAFFTKPPLATRDAVRKLNAPVRRIDPKTLSKEQLEKYGIK